MSIIVAVHERGQSVWLNYLRRSYIESGELRKPLDLGVTGITSTPKIFEKAITDSADYDQLLQEFVAEGMPVQDIYQALVVDDIQRAADVLRPIFELSEGLDGYVTVELNPTLAHDANGTVAEARHLLAMVNRANVMVEIPATEAGISAIESLTSDGVNVNATHIFNLEVYEQVAQAYLRGIKSYIDSHSVWRQTPTSVASISLSRIDGKVDELLANMDRPDLLGKTAISIGKVLYKRFCEIFSGNNWEKLEQRGARVQRPKWTRTTPRNFKYPETYYVEALIGPDTVCTMSPAVLSAFRLHGRVGDTLVTNIDIAERHLQTVHELGIDLTSLGQELQRQSLLAFDRYFQDLTRSVSKKRDELESDWHRMVTFLGDYEQLVDDALVRFCDEEVVCRIWDHDHTVWKPDPVEIVNRLGWLHIIEVMQENLGRLQSFVKDVKNDGFENAIVLGMGGSSLAPELFAKTFSPWVKLTKPVPSPLEVLVLDTTDPDAIRSMAESLDLSKTLFLVASKSGGTVETLSAFRYFYNLLASRLGEGEAGNHFIAITDPSTGLVELAEQYHFRDIFLNAPNIGGRYSALSYFGLVPASLVGLDLGTLLDRGLGMSANASSCNCPLKGDNIAAQLGTIMGVLAESGRDKVVIVTSASISAFGDWAEQLIAESTGKEGKGIVPVVSEPLGLPGVYGRDHWFIHLRLAGDERHDQQMDALRKAGFPVVTMHLKDIYDLGGMFFVWEMATAVAGHFLAIQPFNQPNVEAAKQLARTMVADYLEKGVLPLEESLSPTADKLASFLEQAKPGDYIAIQAYLQPTAETDAALLALRTQLRDQYKLATTVGYGPRYLHSTGQLHKGDRGNGLFIQLISDSQVDIPIPAEAGKAESHLTFGTLKMAQALGDGRALKQSKRRLIRFDLGKDATGGLKALQGS